MGIELDIDATGTVNAAIIDEQRETSPHTGRPLRRMEVQFRTGSEQERAHVSSALSGGKVTGTSDDGASFKVASHSHSYQQGSDVTTFTVTVEELENLSCDAVVLDEALELVPERYAEQHRDGAIVVELTTTTFGADTDAFESLLLDDEPPHYFQVVRRGLSETPLRMRFGRCLYRDNDDGSRQHKVVLAQDAYDDRDEPPFRGFNHPEMARIEDAVVTLQQTVDHLLGLLVGNGVVSAADATAIRKGSQEVTPRARRQFDRTQHDDDFTVD